MTDKQENALINTLIQKKPEEMSTREFREYLFIMRMDIRNKKIMEDDKIVISNPKN